ncbi:hypothetical protein Tco_1437875 [Tanacetum coccineum]
MFRRRTPIAISLEEVQIDDKLNFIEEPVEILDREVKRLKQSHIPIVKVLSYGCLCLLVGVALHWTDFQELLLSMSWLLLLFLFLSNTSEESVGSHAPRVILFGFILAIIPIIHEVPIVPADPIVTPEVGAVSVVLPARADGESESAEQRPVLSSHDTLAPLSEFPLAPVVAPPRIRRRSTTLIRPGKAIPFGRPYGTHLNGPHKFLTARKRVRPLPARRLTWRRVSHHSSDRHSSPDSSPSSAPSDHSLSGHTPLDTTDADSSTPQRFVHRSLARTP